MDENVDRASGFMGFYTFGVKLTRSSRQVTVIQIHRGVRDLEGVGGGQATLGGWGGKALLHSTG